MQTMLQSSSTAGSFAEDDQRHRLHSHNQLPQQQQKQQQQQQLHEPLIESSTQSFSFDEEELVDDDDPSILESMLAKAKELANEIKDTCGSSSSATDRSVGSHKSATATTTTSDKIDPAVVPHSIDVTGENATVCSSVGYGTVYSRDNARDNKLASVDVRSHGSFPKANDSPLRIEAFHYGELKYQEESKQDKSYSIPISAVTVDADATARTSKESQPAEACHNHSAESLFCVPSPFAVSHSGQQSNGTSPSNRKRNEVVCGPFSIVEEQKSETNTGANLTFSTQVTPLTTNRTPTWDATETDEDYAPIADYIGNSGVNKTIPTQKVKTLGNDVDIKWELVTSAYMGDDDYVPMSDYSSSNATGNYKSTKNENPEFLDMTYAGHRAAIRRKRKQRRRRLVRLIAAALLAIFLFFLKNALNFNRKAMVERQVLESTVTESICEAQFEGIFPLPESPIAEELESTLLLEVTEMVDHEEPNGSNHGTLSSLLCFVLLMCRSDGRNVWSIPDPQERRRIVEGILDTMFQ